MLDYKYDIQLLIAGEHLASEQIIAYINDHLDGDCLLVVGGEELIKVHFHTNEPWLVLKYCDTLGDMHDIIIENMVRQANGLQG